MKLSQAPIGIYDSGVGGLTVWLALKELINEDLIYYGDTAHLPYGDKTKEQILFYSHTIIDFLQQQDVRLVVVACNTSSALALHTLKLSSRVPLFGVITPAVKKGVATTKNKRVGLIATVGTIDSGSYQKEFKHVAPDVQLFAQKCPRLVPLIEAGKITGREVSDALHEYLDPLIDQDIDTLILGCTHYPFLMAEIRKIVGSKIEIVDPAWQTARDVYEWLVEHGYNQSYMKSQDIFWTSGNPAEFQKNASYFLQREIDPVHHHHFPAELPQVMELWRGDD